MGFLQTLTPHFALMGLRVCAKALTLDSALTIAPPKRGAAIARPAHDVEASNSVNVASPTSSKMCAKNVAAGSRLFPCFEMLPRHRALGHRGDFRLNEICGEARYDGGRAAR